MIGTLSMSVGDIQEWSVKVSSRLHNYLRSYDNLKSSKSLPIIITHRHAWQREALSYK